MQDVIYLCCDECCEIFEINRGIGLSMLAFAEGTDDNKGDPILCPDCDVSAQWAQEEYGNES